jgi:peptidoglycan/xylan/chitin deacetylase (PgdA/CDA1 family)
MAPTCTFTTSMAMVIQGRGLRRINADRASYTANVLQQLDAAGHKATFFMNGQNYDSIYNYQPQLQQMIAEGHQIGAHT